MVNLLHSRNYISPSIKKKKKSNLFLLYFIFIHENKIMSVPVIQHFQAEPQTDTAGYGTIPQVSKETAVSSWGEDVLENKKQEQAQIKNLILRAQQGDNRARELLYSRFKTPLFNLAYRYTYNRAAAEDLLHDIFIKIFGNIHSLDTEKAFVSWIYRVAVNTCLSHIRRRKNPVEKAAALDEAFHVEEKRDRSSSEKEISGSSLEEALNLLPGKLKSVFLLHDHQGFKHEEIAEIMSWSIGTSKSQLFKARKKIREHLMSRGRL